jgi:GNAT superfamily N-acetyltransferase
LSGRADVVVRSAERGDFEAVAGLLSELGRPSVLGATDEKLHRQAFDDYLSRKDAVALVAQSGEQSLVGFCDLEFRPRLAFLGPQAWIPDLIVSEPLRSRGVGSALLARAEQIARERGCWGMSLESATWRTRAHAFYLREGWSESGKSFTKSLSGQRWPPPPRDE